MLTRPEIAILTDIVHRHVSKLKPFERESPDMFEFRLKPYKDLLAKLADLFEGAK